jgi:hypothetical protein
MKQPCHLCVLRSCSLLLGALQLAVLLVTFERAGASLCRSGFRIRFPSDCRFHVCRHDLLLSAALEADDWFDAPTRPNLSASGYTGRSRRKPPISSTIRLLETTV